MTTEKLTSIVGLKGDKEVQLPPEQKKTIIFEGRAWKRNTYSLNPWFQFPLKKLRMTN